MIQAADTVKAARGEDSGLSAKLTLSQIDAQWLNRKLTNFLSDKAAEEVLKLESQILALIGNASVSQRECERKLIAMVTNKNVALVSHILKNRDVVYFGTRLQ